MSKLSNVPQSIGCIKARRRCCDAHGRRQTLLLCHITAHQTVRDAAASKHETKSVTQQRGHGREWGLGKVPPPGTAAVSKHETGTVAKQTTGALQFMVAFAFGGGGCNISGNMSHFLVPWEAGGPSPLRSAHR